MNTKGLTEICSKCAECPWQSKYKNLSELYKDLEHSFNQAQTEYSNKMKALKLDVDTEMLSKLKLKKKKISDFKQTLLVKDSEICELRAALDILSVKIRNLRKCRQQSFDTINYLEAEIERTKSLCQTPVKSKKCRKSVPGMFEINTQILSFEINEVSEAKKNDQEKLIENQSKLIQAEKQKTKNLKNKLGLVLNEKKYLLQELEELELRLKDYENKSSEIKQKLSQEFTEKIEKLKIENSELKFRLSEFEEKDSGISTSDCEFIKVNELEMLENFGMMKEFEESVQGGCRNCSVNQKNAESLKLELEKVMKDNGNLKRDLEKRKKVACELNKILMDNKKAFDEFRAKFDFAGLHQEIEEKSKEKAKIHQEILQKTKEKVKIQQEIDQKVKEKLKIQQEIVIKSTEFTRLTESLINRKITKPESIDEFPKENNVALQVLNSRKIFPDDYKKRRNIGSWSFSFQS